MPEELAGARGREDAPGQQERDGRSYDERHKRQVQRHGESQDPVEYAVGAGVARRQEQDLRGDRYGEEKWVMRGQSMS